LSGIVETQFDHVFNFGGHSAGDVTTLESTDDVTNLFVVLPVDYWNNLSNLKNEEFTLNL
jgi:hypothetical protein